MKKTLAWGANQERVMTPTEDDQTSSSDETEVSTDAEEDDSKNEQEVDESKYDIDAEHDVADASAAIPHDQPALIEERTTDKQDDDAVTIDYSDPVDQRLNMSEDEDSIEEDAAVVHSADQSVSDQNLVEAELRDKARRASQQKEGPFADDKSMLTDQQMIKGLDWISKYAEKAPGRVDKSGHSGRNDVDLLLLPPVPIEQLPAMLGLDAQQPLNERKQNPFYNMLCSVNKEFMIAGVVTPRMNGAHLSEHYLTVIIRGRRTERHVYIINSLKTDSAVCLPQEVEFVRKAMNASVATGKSRAGLPRGSTITVNSICTMQQTDVWNCGVWALDYILHFTKALFSVSGSDDVSVAQINQWFQSRQSNINKIRQVWSKRIYPE
jgi:hypothetical protein